MRTEAGQGREGNLDIARGERERREVRGCGPGLPGTGGAAGQPPAEQPRAPAPLLTLCGRAPDWTPLAPAGPLSRCRSRHGRSPAGRSPARPPPPPGSCPSCCRPAHFTAQQVGARAAHRVGPLQHALAAPQVGRQPQAQREHACVEGGEIIPLLPARHHLQHRPVRNIRLN